jgi:phage FluMu protein Com
MSYLPGIDLDMADAILDDGEYGVIVSRVLIDCPKCKRLNAPLMSLNTQEIGYGEGGPTFDWTEYSTYYLTKCPRCGAQYKFRTYITV